MCRNNSIQNIDLPMSNRELTDFFIIKPLREMIKFLR